MLPPENKFKKINNKDNYKHMQNNILDNNTKGNIVHRDSATTPDHTEVKNSNIPDPGIPQQVRKKSSP